MFFLLCSCFRLLIFTLIFCSRLNTEFTVFKRWLLRYFLILFDFLFFDSGHTTTEHFLTPILVLGPNRDFFLLYRNEWPFSNWENFIILVS